MDNPASAVPPVDRPVFVLGERQAAMELIRALGDTATVCALPLSRLLPDLVSAVERAAPATEPLAVMGQGSPILPASWYREVQAGWLRFTGKTRTVEFSALSPVEKVAFFRVARMGGKGSVSAAVRMKLIRMVSLEPEIVVSSLTLIPARAKLGTGHRSPDRRACPGLPP